MGFRRFEEIVAWQLADKLCAQVWEISQRPSFGRDERLRSQLIDAGRSGPRNIAEGFARWNHRDFARFVRIGKASEAELLNHFKEARRSGHISAKEQALLEHAAKKALKAANGLVRWLEQNPDPD